MTTATTTLVRRNRILDYLSESATVSFSNYKAISDELEIPYDDVKNDIVFLRNEEKKRLKNYNMEGLARNSLRKNDRLAQIGRNLQEIATNSKDDGIKIKAHMAEVSVLSAQFELEADGITVFQDEMERRKKEKAPK